MLRRILSIAANTFRETIRNKILYAILAFALFIIGLTFFLADLSVGDFARIIADVGLASIHIFGVVMAIFWLDSLPPVMNRNSRLNPPFAAAPCVGVSTTVSTG